MASLTPAVIKPSALVLNILVASIGIALATRRPILDDMMESGLVTLEKARVLQYGKKRSGYLERLKKSMRNHLHLDSGKESDISS